MDIIQYRPDLLSRLTQFYNDLTAEVPHCYPVKENEFELAINKVVTGDYSSNEKHRCERVFIAISDDTIKAFVHTTISLKAKNEEEDVGFIRFLGYERGERKAGQAVLNKAEEYFKTCNISRIFAFSQNDRYRFFHFEHAYLSDALDHIHGLLGYNGYRRSDGEVFLDWENYEVAHMEAPLPVTLNVEWKDEQGQRPNILIEAYLEDKKIGECDSLSCGEFSSHPDAQDWHHTVWLGIEEEFQGQGLGRYLLNHTLQEMHNVGYRHAAISTNWENYRALLFYSNCGYKVVDWTYEYETVLAEAAE